MTPSLPDLLIGQAASLAAPQPVEAGGDYMAGRLGMLAMLAVLMAQEAERGLAARVWENGLAIDPKAMAWWSLFAAVKGQAIWTSSAKAWKDGGFIEPILAFSGWYTARRHDEILAERLSALEVA